MEGANPTSVLAIPPLRKQKEHLTIGLNERSEIEISSQNSALFLACQFCFQGKLPSITFFKVTLPTLQSLTTAATQRKLEAQDPFIDFFLSGENLLKSSGDQDDLQNFLPKSNFVSQATILEKNWATYLD